MSTLIVINLRVFRSSHIQVRLEDLFVGIGRRSSRYTAFPVLSLDLIAGQTAQRQVPGFEGRKSILAQKFGWRFQSQLGYLMVCRC